MTFAEEYEQWLYVFKIGTMKPTSFDSIEKVYRIYIKPKLGMREFDKVTSLDLMMILNQLKIRQYSYSVNIQTYYALKMFYDFYTAKNDVLNIMDCITPPSKRQFPKKEVKIFTEAELEHFLPEALSTYSNGEYRRAYGLAILIYLNTGLRLGELLALEISDYNKNTRELCINKNAEIVEERNDVFQPTGKKICIIQQTPKTETSNRILRVNQITAQYIEYYIDVAIKRGCKFILSNQKGNFVSPNSMRSCYYKTLKAAEVPKRGIHSLRHTFATTLLKTGTDIKVVSKLLGHASVKITYDTYIHFIEDDYTDALDTLVSAYNLNDFAV